MSSPDATPPERVEPVHGPIGLGAAIVESAIEGCQAEHVLEPCNLARSVAVDTSGVRAVDFDIDAVRRDALIERGRTAARAFLDGWDFATWTATCRPAPSDGTP